MPYIDIIRRGVTVGQYYVSDTPDAPRKRVYSLGDFVRACTPDEWSVIEEKAQLTTAAGRAARRILRIWLAAGVDMNDPFTVQALQWLDTNTTEWTTARVNELVG